MISSGLVEHAHQRKEEIDKHTAENKPTLAGSEKATLL